MDSLDVLPPLLRKSVLCVGDITNGNTTPIFGHFLQSEESVRVHSEH